MIDRSAGDLSNIFNTFIKLSTITALVLLLTEVPLLLMVDMLILLLTDELLLQTVAATGHCSNLQLSCIAVEVFIPL